MPKCLQSIYSYSLSGNKAQVLGCNHNFASVFKGWGGVTQSDNMNIYFLNMQEKNKKDNFYKNQGSSNLSS